MTDEQKQPEENQEPEVINEPIEAQPVIDPQPVLSTQEIEEGKTFAILSYALGIIGIPFFLVPLIMRNNEFSLFHAKQNLGLWLLGIAGGIVSAILSFICIGIILAPILGIFVLVLLIMGLMNSISGEMKELPLIGPYASEWFKGLKKVDQ